MDSGTRIGAITLLFTDIEDSTQLWEQEPERMPVALARHDALVRAAVDAHHGTVVKMIGDGTHAVFDDPLHAVSAALQLQQVLFDPASTGGLALSIRCGLHWGVVERRDNDFFGNAVNRAARITGIAYGGQILVSQAIADLVGPSLPEGSCLRDLGDVRLKGVASPERVYQIVHPRLRQEFPALRSLEATPNNLPQQPTSFIGREHEIAEAESLLQHTCLLTLLGIGGVGKTRLALRIGGDLLDTYRDGAWFVDLAPIRDPSLVASETAKALGVREEPGRPLVQTLCAHFQTRKLLLILDNCEHLIQPSAELAHSILRAAPDVRILSTSREALNVPGEQTYPVLPLPVPDRGEGIEALARSTAVRLFIERAQLHKPSFSLSRQEAPALAELVARLEGIPLALELAAARMRSQSVAEINRRLNERFKLLTGGSRVALERQQTLRALVNWSYDLLRQNEQILLDRLSVFVGGFELEGAEAVCAAEPLVREDILDLVTSLVEKSLAMVRQEDDGSRYRMLETIREFAHESLVKREDLAATAARHCDYFLSLAKTARPKLQGPDQAKWMRRLEVELDNLRAGIALALAGEVDPVLAVKFEVGLMGFRILRGYLTEGRNNIRAALDLPGMREPNLARGHALYVGGALAFCQSDHAEATRLLTESLAIRQGLGNMDQVAGALSTLGSVHLQAGGYAKARECEEQCLAIFRKLGTRIGEATALGHLGEISMQLGEDSHAAEMFEECLAIARSIKFGELEAECERYLGELALDAGNLQPAQERLARSLKVCRDAGDKRNEAIALWCLGKADAANGDGDSAGKRFAEALPAFQAFEMNSEALDCLEDCAELSHAVGRTENAVRLYAAAAAIRGVLVLRSPRGEARRQRNLEAARSALGNAAFEQALAAGRRWKLEEATEHALAWRTDLPMTARSLGTRN